MNSNELSNKITQYKNSLNKIITTKNNLNSSIQILNSIINTQSRCYTIDDNNATGNYLINLLEKQKKILSNIDNNIIPAINKTIKNTQNQYIDAKQKEMLESEAI